MTTALQKRIKNLPVKAEKLQRWLLIGKAKLKAQMAAVKAIDNLDDGVAARQAALEETQGLAEELLYAEARLGGLLEKIPKPKLSKTINGSGRGTIGTLPTGVTKKQSHNAQQLHRNPDVIVETVAKARDKGDIPVRSRVLRTIQKNRKSKSKTPSLPEGKYNVIYADPPWEYRNTGVDGAAEKQYSTLSISELCSLGVKSLAAENAVLFLWVTNPLLEECFPVIKSWGFKYKTNLCWVKENKKSGIGFYVRGIHELLLICVRGSFLPETTPLSILKSPAREHSRKPDEVYKIIETMYPKGKKLELFARHKRKDWERWGNELLS